MNWKTILPATALMITLMPTAALSKSHSILGGLNPTSSLKTGSSLLGGGTSMLGSHVGGLTSGLTSAVSPISNTLTNNLTNHSLFNNSSSGLLNNGGLLGGNGILNGNKHRGNILSRLLRALGLGKFHNGRFNNNGNIFANSGSNNSALRSLMGRTN
jgi:hypothetical protein